MDIYKGASKGEFYYLYKKTHNKTGLKYLGYTEKDDVFSYRGSGKIWLRHLEKHGDDIVTEILLVTYSHSEIKAAGRYYSELWNIVESKEWANLRIEDGYGGDTVSNKKWITNGLLEKYILKTEKTPEGWKPGRSSKSTFKNSDKQKYFSSKRDTKKQVETYRKNKLNGKYENSYKNRKATFTGKPHNSNTKEKLSEWQLKNSPSRGTSWINNGNHQIRINIENNELPEGYILGRLKNDRSCTDKKI
jgi:hypothetical protein